MSTITLLPELTPDQYQALKSDIEANGILVPVIRTETGETIDGHHREQIAAELGITNIPVQTVKCLGEEERRHMAIRLNANRRQMSADQKRHLIREELKRSPDLSNNWLGELLGVDGKTVQSVRLEGETTGAIPKVTELRGKDGKKRKKRRSARQQQVAAEAKSMEAPALLSISTTNQEPVVAVPTVQLGEPTISMTDQPPAESVPATLPMNGAQPTFEQYLTARMAAHGIQGTTSALIALMKELGVDVEKFKAA